MLRWFCYLPFVLGRRIFHDSRKNFPGVFGIRKTSKLETDFNKKTWIGSHTELLMHHYKIILFSQCTLSLEESTVYSRLRKRCSKAKETTPISRSSFPNLDRHWEKKHSRIRWSRQRKALKCQDFFSRSVFADRPIRTMTFGVAGCVFASEQESHYEGRLYDERWASFLTVSGDETGSNLGDAL